MSDQSVTRCQPGSTSERFHVSASNTACVAMGTIMAFIGGIMVAGIWGACVVAGFFLVLVGMVCDLRDNIWRRP